MSPPKTPNPSSLTRLLLSHFSTLLHLIKSLPSTPSSVQSAQQEEEDAGGLLLMAVGESTKLLPWIMGARKHVRAYLKVSPSFRLYSQTSKRRKRRHVNTSTYFLVSTLVPSLPWRPRDHSVILGSLLPLSSAYCEKCKERRPMSRTQREI